MAKLAVLCIIVLLGRKVKTACALPQQTEEHPCGYEKIKKISRSDFWFRFAQTETTVAIFPLAALLQQIDTLKPF